MPQEFATLWPHSNPALTAPHARSVLALPDNAIYSEASFLYTFDQILWTCALTSRVGAFSRSYFKVSVCNSPRVFSQRQVDCRCFFCLK
jgi:hypothetical protein